MDKILKTKINRNLTEGNKNSIQEKEERKAFYEKKTDQKKTLIRNSFDLPHHQIPTEGNMTREAVARVAAAENSCNSRAQADKDIDYLGLLLCISAPFIGAPPGEPDHCRKKGSTGTLKTKNIPRITEKHEIPESFVV